MQFYSGLTTPCYLYDLDVLELGLQKAVQEASAHNYFIHYALKANNNPRITRLIKEYGMGADCVSGAEVQEALDVGFAANKIVYAGVGKSDQEIELALRSGIFAFNCESYEELQVIEQIASGMGKVASIALRVNPGVKAHTHHYITTGLEENKFGIHLSQLQQSLDFCQSSQHIEFLGLHFHIGSQITNLLPYEQLCHKVNRIWQDFNLSDYGATLLNLGGGLGIDYSQPQENPVPDFSSFFRVIASNLNIPSHVSVHFELGRSLVGQCGSLITKVLYTKQGLNRDFVIADAGMTELMRPALYQAVHKIDNLTSKGEPQKYDVVGPVCESSDVFAKEITLPQTERGDILAIRSAGAYAESMMLRYNMRAKAGSYFIQNGKLVEPPSLILQEATVRESN